MSTCCPCHGRPMSWHADARRRAGGYWRCLVRKRALDREAKRRYRSTPGTYAYNESHGLGLPGLQRYITRPGRDLRAQRVRVLEQLAQVAEQTARVEREIADAIGR